MASSSRSSARTVVVLFSRCANALLSSTPPSDVHSVGTERVDPGTDVIDPELLHQEVGGKIAADGDHELAQLRERACLAHRAVELGFRVVKRIQFVGGAVRQAVKLVADGWCSPHERTHRLATAT